MSAELFRHRGVKEKESGAPFRPEGSPALGNKYVLRAKRCGNGLYPLLSLPLFRDQPAEGRQIVVCDQFAGECDLFDQLQTAGKISHMPAAVAVAAQYDGDLHFLAEAQKFQINARVSPR